MQSAVPLGEGGMLAVLGSKLEIQTLIKKILKILMFLANDNSRTVILSEKKVI